MEKETGATPESKKIIEELNAILENNFRKLDQINSLGDILTMDMVTVAALHLLTERESELEESGDGKVERYTRKSFLNDMTEIGLEIDDALMDKIQVIIENGYVKLNGEGGYHADNSAIDIVNSINKMYPGMPGMSLVAYVIQTLDEILSGRKDLEMGLDLFDKALESKGHPLSFVYLRTEKKTATQKAEERIKQAKEREESRKASDQLKRIYAEKLTKLRQSLLQSAKDPMVVTKRAIGANDITIKEISPQKIKEAKERERLEKERIENERLEAQRLERERIEEEKAELERQKQELERLAREKEEQAKLEAERLEREAREKEEAQRLTREEEARALEQERLDEEKRKQEESKKELSVEDQIAAFEREQAGGCPLCHDGKILQETTETNRGYYKCTNASCKFISWDKPHLFPCPQCRNPYLLEFRKPDGSLGLKCPLATCSYAKDGIAPPGEIPTPQLDGAPLQTPQPALGAAPKKKRLVRRKRR